MSVSDIRNKLKQHQYRQEMSRRLLNRFAEDYGELSTHPALNTEVTQNSFTITGGHPRVAIVAVYINDTSLKIAAHTDGGLQTWVSPTYGEGCELIDSAVARHCIKHGITSL